MGLDTFRMIMADPRFDNMPLILRDPGRGALAGGDTASI